MSKLALVGLVGTILLGLPRANACGEGGSPTGTIVGVSLLVNGPFLLHDVSVKRSSRGYGVAEAMIMGLELLVSGGAYLEDPRVFSYTLPFALPAAALFVHGLYVAFRAESPREPSLPVSATRASYSLVPTVVSDGVQVGSGVGIVGRF